MSCVPKIGHSSTRHVPSCASQYTEHQHKFSPTCLSCVTVVSSPNPDLLSTHPVIRCEDPRQDGISTKTPSSTVRRSVGFRLVPQRRRRERWLRLRQTFRVEHSSGRCLQLQRTCTSLWATSVCMMSRCARQYKAWCRLHLLQLTTSLFARSSESHVPSFAWKCWCLFSSGMIIPAVKKFGES